MAIKEWTEKTTIELVGVIVLIPVSVWIFNDSKSYLVAWVTVLGFLIAFSMICGAAITGRMAGVLIDSRNVMSLSRLQLLSWTLIILSAFLTVALLQVFAGDGCPEIAVTVQPEIWALLGISTTTLLASPLLLEIKAAQTPDAEDLKLNITNLEKLGDTEETLGNKGLVVINKDIAKARFSDIFTGEEVGNAAHIDIARLQMLLFTVVSIVVYAFKIGELMQFFKQGCNWSFPVLDRNMIVLIGISHGGYLMAKAAPQSSRAKN